jgi:hypothetical protein
VYIICLPDSEERIMGSVGQIIDLAAIATIDPGYKPGSPESFSKLKEAFQTIHEGHRIP